MNEANAAGAQTRRHEPAGSTFILSTVANAAQALLASLTFGFATAVSLCWSSAHPLHALHNGHRATIQAALALGAASEGYDDGKRSHAGIFDAQAGLIRIEQLSVVQE